MTKTMTASELFAAAPDLVKKWTATSYAIASSLEPALVRLVEIRASQINGCANCLNMHTVDARAHGETEQRIYLLSAWREAPCYTERERAALGWTDALTRLSEGPALAGASDALAAKAKRAQRAKTRRVMARFLVAAISSEFSFASRTLMHETRVVGHAGGSFSGEPRRTSG